MGKLSLKSATFILLLTPTIGWSALEFEDHAFPEFITSARALALGNTYMCKSDDSWAAFYNPAGLGTVRGPQFHIANLHLEGNKGLLDTVGDGTAAEFPGNYMDSYDPEEMRTLLAENQGTLTHSRFNFFPNITVRGMAIGFLYSQQNRAIINDDADNEYEIAERRDYGPVFSLNASLFGGVWKIGATAVYLNRRELQDSFGPTEDVVIDDTDYKFGKSLQITLGTRLTIPVTWLPTFAAVLRNATDNDFEGDEFGGPPDAIPQTVDVGFSLTPQIGKITRVHMEVNLKDVGDEYETDIMRRVGAGIELDFNRRIFLRGGYGDGWGSGGLGVRSRTFIMDLTTYAVERSPTEFRESEDRRYVFSISSGF